LWPSGFSRFWYVVPENMAILVDTMSEMSQGIKESVPVVFCVCPRFLTFYLSDRVINNRLFFVRLHKREKVLEVQC
jgi:hypothetical protein